MALMLLKCVNTCFSQTSSDALFNSGAVFGISTPELTVIRTAVFMCMWIWLC